ncbi:MAG TPA: RtcB family protein [bacterium]|nr:RtcB family protein [bacterium]
MTDWQKCFHKISDYKIKIPRTCEQGMRVPGMVYAGPRILESLLSDDALQQVVNVAMMPGIQKFSLAMPDIHFGYGFPIGGVAAMSVDDGVISPGGVGFDINCGVRLISTNIEIQDIRKKADRICSQLFRDIPTGLGCKGEIRLDKKKMDRYLSRGATQAVKDGYGWDEDIEFCEANGALEVENTEGVSPRARERGRDQLGTLGSGNHFVEIQEIQEIFDERAARIMGLDKGFAAVMIHSGSRGLGHQVCDDFIRIMREAGNRYGIELPDRQLSCAPVKSPEGRDYLEAMSAAANFAWANRQVLMHRTRHAFESVFGASAEKLGMHLVYDVAHNIAKIETHTIDGSKTKLCVHRKGATRAFPAGHPEIPARYSGIGQPVFVPGDMGRASYVLLGTECAMDETWGSICHGAGRLKSRSAAKKHFSASRVIEDLESRGVTMQARSKQSILEEAPQAYKNVDHVVDTCVNAGLATIVAKLRPVVVIKG